MPVTINGTTGITTPAENTSALTVGSITGILKATSGVVSQAVAGTDYLVGGGSAITSTNTAKAWVNFDGTDILANISGTYSQSGTTVTVTIAGGHGLSQGQGIYSDITSGTAVDGSYTVASITSPTIFTYTAGTSLTTSGNITLNRSSIRSQYNVSSVTRFDTARYRVNFATPMNDTSYCGVGGVSQLNRETVSADNTICEIYPISVNQCSFQTKGGGGGGQSPALTCSLAIFGN